MIECLEIRVDPSWVTLAIYQHATSLGPWLPVGEGRSISPLSHLARLSHPPRPHWMFLDGLFPSLASGTGPADGERL